MTKSKILQFVQDFAKSEAAPTAGAPLSQPKNLPVGTIKNGRQKVSAMPAKWIDIGSGQRFHSENHPEPHSIDEHLETKQHVRAYMAKWGQHLDPADRPLAEEKVRLYLEKMHNIHNLSSATNIAHQNNQDTSQHTTSSKAASTEADRAYDDLLKFVKEAKERKREKAKRND